VSILSPDSWPFDLNLLPPDAYLVGGAVRDSLLKRRSPHLDLDFVLPRQAVTTARQIANRYKAGFVLLDAERRIARVVFDRATVDFAKLEGTNLVADLQRRDYTINAIAYNPHTGEWLDPLGGRADLERRVLRMVSPTNLADDPLRLLRAYRQAAQLNFAIEAQTQGAIAQLARLLRQVAPERIQTELEYLLDCPSGGEWIAAAWEVGLLQPYFPDATGDRLRIAAEIERAAAAIGDRWPALKQEFAQNLHPRFKVSGYRAIAKLATLLPREVKAAETQLMQLKFSRAQMHAAVRTLKGWLRLTTETAELSALDLNHSSPRSLYFLFEAVDNMFPALVAIAVAGGMPLDAWSGAIGRYLDPQDIIAHPTPLVTGKQLMQALGLRGGPQIGQLLADIQLARVEGRIHTPEDALDFAAQCCDRGVGGS
jgi:tRNA nucleotidyltransferase (CCA-adding enzyme)